MARARQVCGFQYGVRKFRNKSKDEIKLLDKHLNYCDSVFNFKDVETGLFSGQFTESNPKTTINAANLEGKILEFKSLFNDHTVKFLKEMVPNNLVIKPLESPPPGTMNRLRMVRRSHAPKLRQEV